MQNEIIYKKLCVPLRITAKARLQSIEMGLLQKSLFIQFISTFLIVSVSFIFLGVFSSQIPCRPGFLKSHLGCIGQTRLFHFVVRVLLQIFPHAQSSISKQAQQLMTMKLELRSPWGWLDSPRARSVLLFELSHTPSFQAFTSVLIPIWHQNFDIYEESA